MLFHKRVYERKADAVVRFSDPHPERASESFFYNVLLDTVPFTSEADNESRMYYEECCKRWAGDGEALERRLEDYHRRHMHDAEVVQHSLMAIQRNYHVDGGDVVARGDDYAGAAAVEQLLQLPPRRPLNADQQRVVDAILAEPHGLHIVIGGPGTGKSYLLDALAIELQHAGKTVMKSATTGIAATRIADAGTVHSNYRINFDRRRYFLTGLDPIDKDVQRLRAIGVGIIDEAFMMDTNVLAAVVGRLEGACNDTAPGAGAREKLLVLIGDDMQLPPVCRCRGPRDDEDEADRDLEGCERCHLGNSPYLAHAKLHRLYVSVRHAEDPGLAQFLAILPRRLPTAEEVAACFGSCVLAESDREAFMSQPTARSIHAHLIAALDAGVARMRRELVPSRFSHAIVEPKHNLDELRAAGADVEAHVAWAVDRKFHRLTEVAVGAPVLLTANLNVATKAVNGATGVVTDLKFKTRGTSAVELELQTVSVQLDSTQEKVHITRSVTHTHWGHGTVTAKRSTFPLMLGYSLTAHRAQGATFRCPTLIDPVGIFAPGQLYVMVSRNPKRELMRFTSLPAPRDFKVTKIFPEPSPSHPTP